MPRPEWGKVRHVRDLASICRRRRPWPRAGPRPNSDWKRLAGRDLAVALLEEGGALHAFLERQRRVVRGRSALCAFGPGFTLGAVGRFLAGEGRIGGATIAGCSSKIGSWRGVASAWGIGRPRRPLDIAALGRLFLLEAQRRRRRRAIAAAARAISASAPPPSISSLWPIRTTGLAAAVRGGGAAAGALRSTTEAASQLEPEQPEGRLPRPV